MYVFTSTVLQLLKKRISYFIPKKEPLVSCWSTSQVIGLSCLLVGLLIRKCAGLYIYIYKPEREDTNYCTLYEQKFILQFIVRVKSTQSLHVSMDFMMRQLLEFIFTWQIVSVYYDSNFEEKIAVYSITELDSLVKRSLALYNNLNTSTISF